MKRTAMLALAVLAAACARGDDYAVAYHGKLVRADGQALSTRIPMPMEFRLFLSETPDSSAPLWGRSTAVRFDENGLFYTELRDSAGTAVEGALHGSIADAVAAAGGSNVWISVTTVGYGELLPRKRLGGVHRAEHAVTAVKADRVEASSLTADAISVRSLSVGRNLTVKEPVSSGGFSIRNTITPKSGVSLGLPGGTVIFPPSFDHWSTLSWSETRPASGGNATSDTFGTFSTAELGVYTMPFFQGHVGWPAGFFRLTAFQGDL